MLKEHGVEAVILDHSIDSAFISHVEMKKEDIHFKRVDSDISDLMKDTEEATDEETSSKENELVSKIFKKALNKEEFKIQLESLKTEDMAGMIILSEDSRRMQDMMKRYGMGGFNPGMMPNEEILVLNKKHSLIKYVLEHGDKETELLDLIADRKSVV